MTGKTDDKLHQRAKKRIDDAVERLSPQRMRMQDDLEFSNPADPQQWDRLAKAARQNRPCLVFDQTNQYIAQVVNDARQNKPGIKPLPVDNKADYKVAEALEGIIRHIEYVSRAGIAYDTAAEYAARIGLGGFRLINKIVRPETNEQDIVIQRIADPLAMILDPDSTEPDGSDLRWAALEYDMPKDDFEAAYPGKLPESFDTNYGSSSPWFTDKTVRLCDYYEIQETKKPRVVVTLPDGEQHLDQEEYDAITESTGIAAPITRKYDQVVRKVIALKMSGCDILEQSEFPCQYIPVFPVVGYELFIKGQRYLCGMVRRMRDAQQAYNYERTAYIEAVALQPSAPYMAAAEAIAGYEAIWRDANTSRKSYLPYNHVDDAGNALPMPQRQEPPVLPSAFVQGGQMALGDIQASIGMYRANLGAPSNETSGKAITARQREGDTANFHYQDNLNRSIEQLGRAIVDMIPRIYDSKRIARILGLNGDHKFVVVDPDQQEAYVKTEDGTISINPGIGCYDVRIVSGPSYTTLRQEASEGLSMILQANPQLTPVIGPMWARMQDWPEADKVARALTVMAPPQVQSILEGGEDEQVNQQLQALAAESKQHIDALMQQLQAASDEIKQAKDEAEDAKESQQVEWYKAETERMKALQPAAAIVDPQMVAAIVQQTMQQMLMTQPEPPEPEQFAPEPIEAEQYEQHIPQQFSPVMPGNITE